jgi:exopolyphosphatase / guanosine-5'-triphosphate,3'-diphosphate pyrophosphatase
MAPGGARVAAAIDVGSNSVLLLTIAVASDGRARAIDEAVATTRLGAGLRAGGTLDVAAVGRTRAAVVDFAARARSRGATDVWAFATGAARRAADGAAFAAETGAAAGVPVEILSGGREARLAHAAIVHGLGLDDAPMLAIDTGGATTELTLARGATIDAAVSLSLGALALTEAHGGDVAAVRVDVAAALATIDVPARARAAGATAIASGGTVTALAALALGLARYEPRRVHGARLAAARLGALAAEGARADPAVLDPDRAMLLPAGACIVEGVLRAAGATEVRVSDHGVRHAYLRERLAADGPAPSMEALWD